MGSNHFGMNDKIYALLEKYKATRNHTNALCERLEIEDHCIQPASFVSPPKWHLAHTTWFFEEMILKKFVDGFKPFDETFSTLFNSYYKTVGSHWLQAERGYLSRPTVKVVNQYRDWTDSRVIEAFNTQITDENIRQAAELLEIGINHEQQHQELLLMDIKYILALNPFPPTYENTTPQRTNMPAATKWLKFEAGIKQIGHDTADNVFSFDNESPRHKHYTNGFEICSNHVTNGEFKEFIESGGYEDPTLWLSMGWDWKKKTKLSIRFIGKTKMVTGQNLLCTDLNSLSRVILSHTLAILKQMHMQRGKEHVYRPSRNMKFTWRQTLMSLTTSTSKRIIFIR